MVMADLSSFSVISAKVNKYKDDFSLENVGVAFDWVALEAVLKLNEDEIGDAITDGSMDGGIDAIHIANRDIHVFTCKYATTFDKSKNNFPDADIDNLLVTMDRIYSQTLAKGDVNEALWEKVRAIWDLFETDPSNQGPLNFKYYVCSNKEKLVAHAQKKFETHLDKYRYVEYFYIDQEELTSKLIENKYKKVDGSVTFIQKEYFQRSDGPLQGIVATVAASDLIKLVEDPDNPGQINENAFNDNARIYFKLRNPINKDIYDTALSDENYEFWYLNNGVTIICDECSYTPNQRSPRVVLKNLQIVNGGQTTHSLFEAYQTDREKIDDVLVLVRICQTKDRGISEKISETTNSQTPVHSRDLRSNERIQKYLEDEFMTLGYFYERKKNQYINEPKNKRLDNELLGQIYLAYYLDMPSEAKNQKYLVFDDKKYGDIFNEETTAAKLLLPYRVYLPLVEKKNDIQKRKRAKSPINEIEAFVSRATFHILNGVRFIAERDLLDLRILEDVNKAIDKSIQYVEEVVLEEIKNRGDKYTHDKFFKENRTDKIIRDHILGKYSTTP